MTEQELDKKIEAKIESLDLDKCSECGYHAVSTLEEAVNFGISLMQDEVDRLKSEPPKFIKLDENTEEFSKQNAAIEVITMHKKDINLLIEQNQKLQAENEKFRTRIADFEIGAEQNEMYINQHEIITKLRSLITEMGKALEYYFKGDEWDIGYKAKVALELKEKTLNEIDTNHGGGDSNG